jgi:2-keto-4-pentenoate hydratase/2-oxohepta-3-ene-1,7-dioic acid hydratase in catechol pathway
MKFICYREFDDPNEPVHPGIVIGQKVLPLARVISVAEAVDPQNVEIPEDIYELVASLPAIETMVKKLIKAKLLDHIWQEVGVTLCAPIARPNRLLCIGLNYLEHAKESDKENLTDEPVLFQKASTAVIGSGQAIRIPSWAERVDFEGELGVVIGLAGKDIGEKDALKHVAGYTIVNDVTERTMQKRDTARSLPWFRSKSLDTFAPMGPCIVTASEIKDPQNLIIRTEVNGEVRQEDSTKNMIHSVAEIISKLSHYFALEPGDVIATGTPSGVGQIKPGDTVSITIPEIGTLSNPVAEAI